MNTVQLCHRIGRRARTGDFTTLSLSEQGDLLECANMAIQTVYNLLPTYFKELTEGFVLPAPRTTSFAVVNGSNVLSSDVFSPAEVGRTVVIAGDANWNQVIATNRLLTPYLGATSASVGATVYGDAVFSDRYPFERIIGSPAFAVNRFGPIAPAIINRENGQTGWFSYQNTIGIPMTWWTQQLGNSQGNEPILVLKFAPVPNTDYAINVRMSYWPKRLTLADYNSATTIPVPDQFIEPGLIPICTRALMGTPIWKSMNDEDRVDKAADRAELYLRNQMGQPGAPSNMVFTPVGY